MLFLISKAWLASRWCMNELNLARRLNKRLFGVLIEEGLTVADLPHDVTSTWQLVNLATGRDHQQFRVTLPITGEEVHVTYSLEGLARLKSGLQRAGLHASYFDWPPEHDPKRPPYRGLRPLEAEDAGIFFGREAPVIEAIDRLRGLTEAAPPRLMVDPRRIRRGQVDLPARGPAAAAGARRSADFLPLPVIRPERAAITGETGLLDALAGAFEAANSRSPRADLRAAIEGGAANAQAAAGQRLQKAHAQLPLDGGAAPKPPRSCSRSTRARSCSWPRRRRRRSHSWRCCATCRGAMRRPSSLSSPSARTTTSACRRRRSWKACTEDAFDLPPMPKGSYAEVIKGPARRLDGTARALKIDDALVDALLADIEAGGAKDALPLLAFTLERLYGEYGATGHLKLDHYEKLGRVKGSIEAAVERAFKAADTDPKIPRDEQARLALLRRGLIPWLAGIDPDTGRRVGAWPGCRKFRPRRGRSSICWSSSGCLSTDVAKDTGETTIEPAHEALLRQWGLLQGWLKEEPGCSPCSTASSARRAIGRRMARRLVAGAWRRPAAGGGAADGDGPISRPTWSRRTSEYVAACQRQAGRAAAAADDPDARRHAPASWVSSSRSWRRFRFRATIVRRTLPRGPRHSLPRPTLVKRWRHVNAMRSKDCPEMVVVPPATFTHGLAGRRGGRDKDEAPCAR